MSPVAGKEFGAGELSSSCPLLSSVLDNQKQVVITVPSLPKEAVEEVQAPGAQKLPKASVLRDLVETDYALGEDEIAAVSPGISQTLRSLLAECAVIQVHAGRGAAAAERPNSLLGE